MDLSADTFKTALRSVLELQLRRSGLRNDGLSCCSRVLDRGQRERAGHGRVVRWARVRLYRVLVVVVCLRTAADVVSQLILTVYAIRACVCGLLIDA